VADGFRYERRREWDTSILTPALLKSFARAGGEPVELLGYTTRPAARGLISGRSFVDMRCATCGVDGEGRRTLHTVLSAPPAEHSAEWFELTDREGAVRARNLPGTGVRLVEVGSSVLFTLVSAAEIGGRLPAALVNGATGGSLLGIVAAFEKALAAHYTPRPSPSSECRHEI